MHEGVILIISLCNNQLAIFGQSEPDPPGEDSALDGLFQGLFETMRVWKVLINILLKFARGLTRLNGTRGVECRVQEQVVEVCTDRMSQGDLMETRCLLRLYQIFLL
jgi:hypothetical protein